MSRRSDSCGATNLGVARKNEWPKLRFATVSPRINTGRPTPDNPTSSMITDSQLNTIVLTFGILSMVLILVYHAILTNTKHFVRG